MGALDIFPLSYKVRGRKIVIVGGGAEALAKARLAVKTSARVLVISEELSADFSGLEVVLKERPFKKRDAVGAALIFVASAGKDAKLAIETARQRGVALNVVDQPEQCDFFTPAIVERGPVSIAISTQGAAPVLARLLRARIEGVLDPQLGIFARVGGEVRQIAERLLPEPTLRRRFFERFFETCLNASTRGKTSPLKVRELALNLLGDARVQANSTPHIWLVGAGPGAVDMLTLRAQRLLQQADVIVHERSLPLDLVQMGRRDAHLVVLDTPTIQSNAKPSGYGAVLGELATKYAKIVWLVRGNPQETEFAQEFTQRFFGSGVGTLIVPGVASPVQGAAPLPSLSHSHDVPPAAYLPGQALPNLLETKR